MNNYGQYESSLFPGIKSKKLTKEELADRIKRYKKGDQSVYIDILKHMHNYLCYVTKEFFIHGYESQDIYQECAIKLMNVIEKFDEKKGGFVSFAQSSIRKYIITTLNKENAQKRKALNNSCSLDFTGDDEDNETSYLESVDNNNEFFNKSGFELENVPYDIIQKDYEEYIIDKVSEKLSEKEKMVFILRFIRDLSYKEVAEELKLYKLNKKKEYVLDHKSVDNAIWRSRPKIKKTIEKLRDENQFE